MKLKTQLMPKGLNFNDLDFDINGKVATIMTVISYPKVIEPGFLANLSSLSGVKVIIKNIPIPFALFKKLLNQELIEFKQRYQEERDSTLQERVRQQSEALEKYIEMVSNDQSRIFDLQMHVLISAKDREELEIEKTKVKGYLEAMELIPVSLLQEQETVFKSALPIFKSSKLEKRIGTPLSSFTISAMYPFIFDSIKDEGLAVLMGVDFSGGVILFNQFLYQIKTETNRTNANMLIIGEKESGKTTAAKLLVRSNIRNGSQVVCIDPKNEGIEMMLDYGGEAFNLAPGGEFGMINPFELNGSISKDPKNTILKRGIRDLKAFIKYYHDDITADELIMFERISEAVYKHYGITNETTDLSKYKPTNYPRFSDLYNTLKASIEAAKFGSREHDAMEHLEIKLRAFVTTYKHLFDGHTSISLETDLSSFSFKDFVKSDQRIYPVVYFNAMRYAFGRTLNSAKNTLFYAEKIEVLATNKNQFGLEFLKEVEEQAVTYNTGTLFTITNPNVLNFKASQEIVKELFNNVSYYLIMNLSKRNIENLSELVRLNENEKNSVRRYGQGEGMFICGAKRMRINVVVTAEDLEAFGTTIF